MEQGGGDRPGALGQPPLFGDFVIGPLSFGRGPTGGPWPISPFLFLPLILNLVREKGGKSNDVDRGR